VNVEPTARIQTFAILPAAGRSQRMGQPKLLLPWSDGTVLSQVLGAWRASRVSQVLLVVHPADDVLAELGVKLGAVVVRAKSPPAEMKDSVALGLAEVARSFAPTAADAWLVAPADMPLVTPAMIDAVIAAYESRRNLPGAAATIYTAAVAGKRGHPVLFPWTLAAEVERLAENEGLNTVVAGHPVIEVEVAGAAADSTPFADLDTPEDYHRLRPGGN
jgi:molybdenum cofactor cytidylyltransferase